MRLKTPRFWYKQDVSSASILMAPASFLYGLGYKLNQYIKPPAAYSPIRVICVGNLTAGGAGKTPAACLVMDLIKQDKIFAAPAFLSRGYGRQSHQNFKAQRHHHVSETGDEAQILAEYAPVYLAKNRIESLKLALRDDVDCIIMDDGYQNTDIIQDLKILVVNSYDGCGNKYLIPAGPLREPLNKGLEKADMIFFIQDPRGNNLKSDILNKSGKPAFNLEMSFQTDHID
mgnify:CR=1 FL=1